MEVTGGRWHTRSPTASPASRVSVDSAVDAAAGRREHGEHRRQYALRQRAVAFGWPIEQVVVIDRDLGQSDTSAADREGFQQLVRDVGLWRAGLVMGWKSPAWPATRRTGIGS